MNDSVKDNILQAVQAMSGWEVLAVILALAYVILAVKERIECWYAALASTAIYTALFWDVSLLMESALQIYYFAMAIYGWWQWRKPADNDNATHIHCWPLRNHLYGIGALLIISLTSGYLLAENTGAALPYLDSFTTWASVLTTWMVARKLLENWLYWIVIDAVSIYLYLDRELYLTAALFVLYVIIAAYGYLQWRSRMSLQASPCLHPA